MLVNGKPLFKREPTKFQIDTKEFPMDPAIKKNLANNANNVSIVNFLLTSYPLSEDHYLIQLQKFVNGMLWFRSLDIREFIGLENNTALLDEYIIKHKLIDAFYHFKLSFEVCKRLFALTCQVFTSSHNTYLMTNDLLRPDCNFILNDNKIKPLCDCTDKELRFGHNIEKLFRGNAFHV